MLWVVVNDGVVSQGRKGLSNRVYRTLMTSGLSSLVVVLSGRECQFQVVSLGSVVSVKQYDLASTLRLSSPWYEYL